MSSKIPEPTTVQVDMSENKPLIKSKGNSKVNKTDIKSFSNAVKQTRVATRNKADDTKANSSSQSNSPNEEGVSLESDSSPIGEDNQKTTNKLTSPEWTTVSHHKTKTRPKRDMITGTKKLTTNDTHRLQAAPKASFLHVCRLAPDTTEAELTKYLSSVCAVISCEKLNSKFPNIYSSFKLCVSELNADKVKDPSVWPEGVRISRFFQKRLPMQSVG
ncbi:hypothetical protein PPYR_14660 [Photinus pyralis]|uniref:Uncharacterized protein n=1 Tax=Photinus pyralis TaxID=7054 RepID=A0A5N4A5X4_PHOPY|nr:hypothetical protein PPYR_14660 [Photinus pyralis]